MQVCLGSFLVVLDLQDEVSAYKQTHQARSTWWAEMLVSTGWENLQKSPLLRKVKYFADCLPFSWLKRQECAKKACGPYKRSQFINTLKFINGKSLIILNPFLKNAPNPRGKHFSKNIPRGWEHFSKNAQWSSLIILNPFLKNAPNPQGGWVGAFCTHIQTDGDYTKRVVETLRDHTLKNGFSKGLLSQNRFIRFHTKTNKSKVVV